MANLVQFDVPSAYVASVSKYLKDIEETPNQKEIIEAFKKAARPIIEKGKSNLKTALIDKSRTALLKSLSYRIKRKKTGVIIGFTKPVGSLAHLIDLGHKIYSHGKDTGKKTKATHFWTTVKNSGMIDDAYDTIEDGILAAIQRIKTRNGDYS